MNNSIILTAGLLLPLLGTTLGAGMVFFLKKDMKPGVQKLLLGFASGVMIAASVWSLLIPAAEMAEEQGSKPWLPTVVGFFLGMGFLLLLDSVIPHLHIDSDKPEGKSASLKKSTMLIFAVTLHNLPEGMAVGAVFAGMLASDSQINPAAALALSVGIAIQNFPEGAIISMPLIGKGGIKKPKAFLYGFLSGVVEPAGAILTIFLTSLVLPILPYILSFAAGAMIYVVIEELIPESQSGSHSNIGTIGAAFGFALMMVLDMAFG